MTFRIMTFNIRGAVPHRDGPNAWEHRASLTLSLIERTTPDLIGFQELMCRNLETYQKWLRTYQWVLGPPTMEETRLNYNAIFWNPSRLDLLDNGGFWLSPTPEPFVKGQQRGFTRKSIANQHGHKIDEVVVSKVDTSEAHLVLDSFQDSLMGENLSKGGYFSHPGWSCGP